MQLGCTTPLQRCAVPKGVTRRYFWGKTELTETP